MGIKNVKKVEKLADGNFQVTCDNSCQVETVSKSDLELGRVCIKKYPNRDEGFLRVLDEIKFTTYKDKTAEGKKEISINARYILRRVNKYHHTIENIVKNSISDCLVHRSGNAYKFYWVGGSNMPFVQFEFDENDCISAIFTTACKGIDGHYDNAAHLELELEKRELRKKSKD